MSNSSKVMEALKHVNSIFPEVTQVFYGTDGRWLYCGECFDAPDFDGRVNVGLLEDAADAVESLPAAFALATAMEMDELVEETESGIRDAFRVRAEAEFDGWEFGEGVEVVDFNGWETRGSDDWRRTVFIRLAGDSPDHDSRAVTFRVQFGIDGLVAEVSARLVVDGGIVGNRGTALD